MNTDKKTQSEKRAEFLAKAEKNKANFELHKKLILERWASMPYDEEVLRMIDYAETYHEEMNKPKYHLTATEEFKKNPVAMKAIEGMVGTVNNAYRLAEFMHNTYLLEATKNNWEVQSGTRVAFKDLPHSNRQIMIQLALTLINTSTPKFTISRDKAVEKVQEVLLEWKDTDLPETMKARYVIDSLIDYNIEGWISVSERLPTKEDADENGKVLIYRKLNPSQSTEAKAIHPWNMVKHCDPSTLWQKLPSSPNLPNIPNK